MSQKPISPSSIDEAIRNIVKGYLGSRMGETLTPDLAETMAVNIAESIEQYMGNIAQKHEVTSVDLPINS